MDSFFKKNTNYFIRTVTMHIIGEVIDFNKKELLIKNASWIADSGRFANCLKTGELNEVEPFPDGEIIISRGALVDACIWNHALPRLTK